MKKILLLSLILATFVLSCGNGDKSSNGNTGVQNNEKNNKQIDDSFGVEIYSETLEEAHKNFKTTLIEGQSEFVPDGKLAVPPKDSGVELVKYPTKIGEMEGYITPKNDGKKYPVIMYLNGGFGGTMEIWGKEAPKDNYQRADAFKRDEFVLFVPSARAENNNPGKFEMFYGEIEDLEEARKYVASLPYVDPNRIYLVGHSTGGTKAVLLSEYSKGFRAVFAMGAATELMSLEKYDYAGMNPPFDRTNPREIAVRSSLRYMRSITAPTFHFEGKDDSQPVYRVMQKVADKYQLPFKSYEITGGNHFNIIYPLTTMIAQKILADTEAKTNIQFIDGDIEAISKGIVKN